MAFLAIFLVSGEGFAARTVTVSTGERLAFQRG